MAGRFVIVIESGLSSSAYGAKIQVSDPVDEAAGLDLLGRIVRGEAPEVHTLHKKGITVRVTERQYLDVSTAKATPTRQSRITLAEVVSER